MADTRAMDIERDYFLEAQRAAEAHLAACYEAFYAEQEDDGPLPESPASAPFCACETCEVRETLYAAWPLLREAALAGVDLQE